MLSADYALWTEIRRALNAPLPSLSLRSFILWENAGGMANPIKVCRKVRRSSTLPGKLANMGNAVEGKVIPTVNPLLMSRNLCPVLLPVFLLCCNISTPKRMTPAALLPRDWIIRRASCFLARSCLQFVGFFILADFNNSQRICQIGSFKKCITVRC